MKSISRDIREGKVIEGLVARELVRFWAGSRLVSLGVAYEPGHDFIICSPGGVDCKIEVKCDWKSDTTGNVCVENGHRDSGKASGLMVTQSWRWIHYLPSRNAALVYSPYKMKLWMEESKWELRRNIGDGNADGYIIPLPVIKAREWVQEIPMNLNSEPTFWPWPCPSP